jgi:hypothetical protein
MPGTPKRLVGPAFIANAAADILAAPAATVYRVFTHIHVTNDDSSARTFSLFLGATGGSADSTVIVKTYSLAAAGSSASSWDYYGRMVQKSTDFLSGLASVASQVVIIVEGEEYIVP